MLAIEAASFTLRIGALFSTSEKNDIDFVTLVTEYDPRIYIGGDNNVFWKPMSWAIIYGLTFATFLTLIIVPVMYWWITRMQYKYFLKEAV